MSPFMANHGYHPRSHVGNPTKAVPAANELVSKIDASHAILKSNLTKAISAYKASVDSKRQPHPPLVIGYLFMVEAANFKLPLVSRKIGPFQIGPFKIIELVNDVAFKIELPPI